MFAADAIEKKKRGGRKKRREEKERKKERKEENFDFGYITFYIFLRI